MAHPEPRPALYLLGCAPFVAAPIDRHTGRPLAEEGPCPVCGGAVRDRPDRIGGDAPTVAYCGRCDAMDERHSGNLARQRVEAGVSARAADDRDDEAHQVGQVKAGLKRAELTEAERRRIWMGCRKWIPFAAVQPACLAGSGAGGPRR